MCSLVERREVQNCDPAGAVISFHAIRLHRRPTPDVQNLTFKTRRSSAGRSTRPADPLLGNRHAVRPSDRVRSRRQASFPCIATRLGRPSSVARERVRQVDVNPWPNCIWRNRRRGASRVNFLQNSILMALFPLRHRFSRTPSISGCRPAATTHTVDIPQQDVAVSRRRPPTVAPGNGRTVAPAPSELLPRQRSDCCPRQRANCCPRQRAEGLRCRRHFRL